MRVSVFACLLTIKVWSTCAVRPKCIPLFVAKLQMSARKYKCFCYSNRNSPVKASLIVVYLLYDFTRAKLLLALPFARTHVAIEALFFHNPFYFIQAFFLQFRFPILIVNDCVASLSLSSTFAMWILRPFFAAICSSCANDKKLSNSYSSPLKTLC